MENELFKFYPGDETKYCAVLCLPHSGDLLPPEFEKYLVEDLTALNQDVDFKVFDLIDISRLNKSGIDVIVANNLRTTVDLNRPRNTSLLNWKKNTKGVPLVVKEPQEEEVDGLLGKYYDPYFKFVTERVKKLQQALKRDDVPTIDLHSMPGTATEYHIKGNPSQTIPRPDFCISDLKGKSCHGEWVEFIIKSFDECGFKAFCNDPYFGGEGTKFLFSLKSQAIQIEINRGIYMNEETSELLEDKVLPLKDKLTNILENYFKNFGLK